MHTEQHACTDQVVEESFPCTPDQVGPARRWAAQVYADAGFDPDVCRLLVSEAATNAILHSGSSKFQVRIHLVELWVEVCDETPALPQHRPTNEELADGTEEPSENGRGLPLLSAFAPGWQVRMRNGGKAIRFQPLLSTK